MANGFRIIPNTPTIVAFIEFFHAELVFKVQFLPASCYLRFSFSWYGVLIYRLREEVFLGICRKFW